MKKIFFVVGALFAFFLFYTIGYRTSSLVKKNTLTHEAQNIAAAATLGMPVKHSLNKALKASPKEVLLSFKGGALFEMLFQEKVLQDADKFLTLQAAFQERFKKAYPKNNHEFDNEVVSRMGILKAMKRAFTPENSLESRKALMSFYQNLVFRKEESFSVKRQALQNLSQWTQFLSEKERLQLLAQVPSRLLASASKSEAEIVSEVFHHEK